MAKGKFSFGFKKSSISKDSETEPRKPRPNISEPVGPIKSSRGPDFTRSESLIVVEGIHDCQFAGKRDTKASTKMGRRISSSLVKGGVLSPNVAAANARLPSESTEGTKHEGRRLSISSLISKPKIPLSVSTNMLQIRRKPVARADGDQRTGNQIHSQPPVALKSFVTRLPRSQTTRDVSNLTFYTKSASGIQINNNTDDVPMQRFSVSQVNVDASSTTSTLESPTDSRTQISQSSMSSIDISMPNTPQGSYFNEIDIAQPSKYWTGRFVSLEDRLYAEGLSTSLRGKLKRPINSSTPLSGSIHLTRTMQLPKRDEDGDVERRQRVFEYLESLCTSAEAKLSLRSWQEMYATRTNQPDLHPNYVASARRGLVSRMLPKNTNKKSQVDRRSRDFLDEIYYGNASNAFGLTNAYGINGRYLTFR